MCSSPRLFTTTFHAFHSQSSGAPESRLVRYAQRFQFLPSFAIIQKARYAVRPNRIRFTADCIFASSCSPPRFTTTQLLSATRHVASLDMDFHHADYCASRAHWILAFARKTGTVTAWFNAAFVILAEDSIHLLSAAGCGFWIKSRMTHNGDGDCVVQCSIRHTGGGQYPSFECGGLWILDQVQNDK